MHSWVSVLCLLAAIMGVALAWYNNFDNSVYGGWGPDRRSLSCTPKGGPCLTTVNCCDGTICQKDTDSAFGHCETKADQSYFFGFPSSSKVGTKKKGEDCSDSFECADQCCRLVRLGRLGNRLKCGKPRRYVCVGRQVAPSDMSNDLFGNY